MRDFHARSSSVYWNNVQMKKKTGIKNNLVEAQHGRLNVVHFL